MTSRRFLAGMLLAAGLLPLPRSVSAADEPEAADAKPEAPAAEAPAPKPVAPAVTGTFIPAKDSPNNENVLLTAMEHNPDIRLARSRLRSAQAELNRTRLDVARQVVALRETLDRQAEAKRSLDQLRQNARISALDYRRASIDLAASTADMQYLLGQTEVAAQPEAPDKDSKNPPLDKLLLTAMEKNPDILVAKAKVAEAEDELNRTRLDVARKLIGLHQSLENQRALVARLQRAQSINAKALQPGELEKALMDQGMAEAEFQYLQGRPQFLLEPSQPEKAGDK
ncbi:MAG TPA: hypothetical protein VHY91_26720 [Pirellulales bacterium]|nr:hypothetical protein [Pirellulales bacterium]